MCRTDSRTWRLLSLNPVARRGGVGNVDTERDRRGNPSAGRVAIRRGPTNGVDRRACRSATHVDRNLLAGTRNEALSARPTKPSYFGGGRTGSYIPRKWLAGKKVKDFGLETICAPWRGTRIAGGHVRTTGKLRIFNARTD